MSDTPVPPEVIPGGEDNDDCPLCGGTGWDECAEPGECWDPECDGEVHPCRAGQENWL